MDQNSDLSKYIEEYIKEYFPNATSEKWQHEKQESINFKIFESERVYILRVMNECLDGLQANEIKSMLENYNVAQVMRDIGDFPVVVTNSGCIFGSP